MVWNIFGQKVKKKEEVKPIVQEEVVKKEVFVWDAMYKCRRCGKTFVGTSVEDTKRGMADKYYQHKCSDITWGVGDLTGFENKRLEVVDTQE